MVRSTLLIWGVSRIFEAALDVLEETGSPTAAGLPAGAGAGMSPDVQKQIEESMKNLSPEQQEQVKKMMQGQR